MAQVNHPLHTAIGALSYQTSQTISAVSRAAAHPSEMDGYWPERALEAIAEHQRVLDAMKDEVAGLVSSAQAVAA